MDTARAYTMQWWDDMEDGEMNRKLKPFKTEKEMTDNVINNLRYIGDLSNGQFESATQGAIFLIVKLMLENRNKDKLIDKARANGFLTEC